MDEEEEPEVVIGLWSHLTPNIRRGDGVHKHCCHSCGGIWKCDDPDCEPDYAGTCDSCCEVTNEHVDVVDRSLDADTIASKMEDKMIRENVILPSKRSKNKLY